jgi:glycerol uptake facilitator protein
MARPAPLWACCLAELLGTFLLVFFGCGAVHTAVLTQAQAGLWQVAIVWGIAIMIAIYVFGGISGAHINPAITLALSVWTDFPAIRVLPYMASQLAGAFLAAMMLFALYQPQLQAREEALHVKRGQVGSEITAMCYGEFYPSPDAKYPGTTTVTALYLKGEHAQLAALVPLRTAILAEMLGTMILALAVFALIDRSNPAAPPPGAAPVFIGLTVAILISVIAPLTQACFNPARDMGPRLFAASIGGWGRIALPGLNGWHILTVYVFAPIAGAFAGGGLYQRVLKPARPAAEPAPERAS